jgi:hypothetical protein
MRRLKLAKYIFIGAFIFVMVSSVVVVTSQIPAARQLASAILKSKSVSMAINRVQQFLIPANNAQCLTELSNFDLKYRPLSNFTESDSCFVEHAIRVSSVNNIVLSSSPILTCRMATELAKFASGKLQTIALKSFGSPIKSMSHIGTYNCRSMRQYPGIVSQHGFANAIDISGFTLATGRHINIAKQWNNNTQDAKFLKEVAAAACDGFRVAVSPDADANHWNHFHWDMGPYWSCR